MGKEVGIFTAKLISFATILFLLQKLFLPGESERQFYYSLITIYSFHFLFVFFVFVILRYVKSTRPSYVLNFFIALTLVKIVASILFLTPIFTGQSPKQRIEILHFFVPYFFFLVAEISGVNKFLQKSA